MSYEYTNEIPHGCGPKQYAKRDEAFHKWASTTKETSALRAFNAGWAARKEAVDYGNDN